MGLKDQLTNAGSNLSQWDGSTPSDMPGANPQARVHNQYSINGDPNMAKKPSPSELDLNGVNPKGALSVPGYGQINDTFKNG